MAWPWLISVALNTTIKHVLNKHNMFWGGQGRKDDHTDRVGVVVVLFSRAGAKLTRIGARVGLAAPTFLVIHGV